jgi:hypothetical protein
VAEGLGNREIAKILDLSEHTIKNYLFHIFDKLGISNRVELVLYAVSNPRRGALAFSQQEKPNASISGQAVKNGQSGQNELSQSHGLSPLDRFGAARD